VSRVIPQKRVSSVRCSPVKLKIGPPSPEKVGMAVILYFKLDRQCNCNACPLDENLEVDLIRLILRLKDILDS
jgi:hypothetical protein